MGGYGSKFGGKGFNYIVIIGGLGGECLRIDNIGLEIYKMMDIEISSRESISNLVLDKGVVFLNLR